MTTYKNINFTKRDYEATNIVFCQSEIKPDQNWVECDELEIEIMNCNQLFIQNDVRYFGWL